MINSIKLAFSLFLVYSSSLLVSQETDYIDLLREKLESELNSSGDDYYKLHCSSIIAVLDAQNAPTTFDNGNAETIYQRFVDENSDVSAAEMANYTNRSWSFIIAWESENDGKTSFTWLKLPKDWDPEKEYPLYVQLHGHWDVASSQMEYMAYPFLNQSSSYAFEDGYQISPWGRGNHWYQEFSEIDIWECIAAVKENFKINPQRQYLCGHSMGGYGTWQIAHRSPDNWAAIGLHAAAIWYDNSSEVTSYEANILKDMPTYFVVGTSDGNLSINETAYQLLQSAGNTDLEFVTFDGGHDYRTSDVEAMYMWMKEFVNLDYVSSINERPDNGKVWLSAYPVPTRDNLQIEFYLDESSKVEIALYNQLGQQVDKLAGSVYSPGLYNIKHQLQLEESGVYYLVLKANNYIITRKIVFRD